MSEEQLKAFMEKVKADTSLQEKLKAAADANAVLAIAKEAGFMISADDLTQAQSELSDEELEGMAGGICLWTNPVRDIERRIFGTKPTQCYKPGEGWRCGAS